MNCIWRKVKLGCMKYSLANKGIKQSASYDFSVKNVRLNSHAPVAQKLDSAIHRINHYPTDKH